jgi:hypothetical protein
VIDSLLFREVPNNWELHFAQVLQKPLVVVSLDAPLDESRSSPLVQLVNFVTPQDRDWHRLLEVILGMVYAVH